jgi:uncharacterized protein (TIGR02118 family)
VELSTVVESPLGGESPYHRVGEAWFGSIEEARASLQSPEGQAWTAEMTRFPGSSAEMIVTDTEWDGYENVDPE